MGKTYIDTGTCLKEVKEIIKDGKKEIILIEDVVKNEIKETIEDDKLKLFNDIFDNFNSKTPLTNPNIHESLKGKKGKILDNFITFCKYLEYIIEIKEKKELSKIPLIISNLSNYKGRKENKYLIQDAKNKVMIKYKNKK